MKKKIFILGNESVTSLGLARSFYFSKINYEIFLFGNSKNYVSKSKCIAKFFLIKNDQALTKKLVVIGKKLKSKPLLFPSTDQDILFINKNKHILKKYYFLTSISQNQDLRKLLNKRFMKNIALKAGFKVPNFQIISSKNTIINKDLIFPLIIKPLNSIGTSKKDIYIFYKEKECNRKIPSIIKKYGSMLVEEHISGEGSNVIEVLGYYSYKREAFDSVMISKIISYPKMKGSSCYVKSVKMDNALKKILLEYLKAIKYIGLFDLEIIKKNDDYFFIEINYRAGAPIILAKDSGLNLPCDFTQLLLNYKITFKHKFVPRLFLHEGLAILKLKDGSFFKIFNAFIKSNSYALFHRKDTFPFFFYFLGKLNILPLHIKNKFIYMFKKIDLKKRLKEYKKEIIKKIKFVISPVYQSFDGYILEKKILRKINVCQPKIPVKIEMMNNKNHKNLKIFGPNFSKKKNKNQLKKGQISFLALDGNKVIGMAWFTSGKIFIPQVSGRVFGKKKQVDFGKKTGYIFKVRVLPEYRGFGIGPRLYCEICNYAKRKKLSKIIVSMGIDNINSLKSFKKVGFQKKGRAKYRRILFWSKYNYQDIKNIKRYKNDQLGEN